MTLDQMNMDNLDSMTHMTTLGGYNPKTEPRKSDKKALGHKKNKARSMKLLSLIRRNRKHTKHRKPKKYFRKKRGGSLLADVSVPTSLLLLNQFFKHRKTQENMSKKSKKSKKTKKVRK